MSDNLSNVDEIFCAAIELSSPEVRGEYVERVCGGNAELKHRVDALLAAHFGAGDFLERSPATALLPDHENVQEGPGTLIGPYKLLEQIGEGGMGVVYMADQQAPVRRRVALKIIKAGMDTRQVIARFEAERQALALMDHSNIARVLDAGATDSGRPYFVMELVRGIPITEYCDQKTLSIPGRLELFSQVCQAVQHAHQKGLIHRDIKPSNVLVSTQDDRPVAKVIDFGVAKAVQGPLTDRTLFTEFQHLVGTPAYMSPEQAGGSLDIDTRSDVYSLGVLLYELLAGSPPFDPKELRSKAFAEMQRIIREVEPPTPSTRLSGLSGSGEPSRNGSLQDSARQSGTTSLASIAAQRSVEPRKLAAMVRGELDWIVMKALEKDRTRRYETPSGLARDIERYLRDEQVLACPPSVAYRIKKFVRRNKIAAAFVLLLVVAVASLAISNVQTRRNERRAITETAKAQAVSDLLQGMFASANPDQLKDTQYTVRQMLDDFSESFGAELSDQPEVEAEIRMTIGRIYRALAKGNDAERQVERALELRRELFGPDHEKVAESHVESAQIHFIQSRLPEAVAAAREALRIYRASSTTGLPVIRAETILQRALINSGRFDEAQAVTEDALSTARDTKVEYPEVATILHAQADMLNSQKRFPAAEQVARRSVELHRRLNGPKHPETAWGWYTLGHALKGQQKYAEAEAAFREALAIFRERFRGQHHSFDLVLPSLRQVLEARGDQQGLEALARQEVKDLSISETAMFDAWLTRSQRRKEVGRLKEAAEALEEAGKWIDEDDSAQFEKLIAIYIELGWRHHDQGDVAEAERLFRQVLELNKRRFGDDHLRSATSLAYVAFARRARGEVTESESMYREALAVQRKLVQGDHVDVAFSLNGLALTLAQRNMLADAEAMMREALAMRRRLGANDPIASSLNNLSSILMRQGKFDEAMATSSEALELQPQNAQGYNALAWFLATATDTKLRDPAQAVELAKKAVELAPQDGAIWNTLGVARYRAGEWQAAIDDLQKAMDLRNRGDSSDWFFLAMAHWQLDNKDEAPTLYDKAVEWMDKNAPKNEELLRFRAEAAELLGISEPAKSTDAATQP